MLFKIWHNCHTVIGPYFSQANIYQHLAFCNRFRALLRLLVFLHQSHRWRRTPGRAQPCGRKQSGGQSQQFPCPLSPARALIVTKSRRPHFHCHPPR